MYMNLWTGSWTGLRHGLPGSCTVDRQPTTVSRDLAIMVHILYIRILEFGGSTWEIPQYLLLQMREDLKVLVLVPTYKVEYSSIQVSSLLWEGTEKSS